MKKIIILLFLLISLSSCSQHAISKVTVRDNDFKIISELKGKEELKQFEDIWLSKYEVILRAQPKWSHKIDLEPGDRWLYSMNGYVKILSMLSTSIYKIDNSKQFNMLLKIQ